MQYILFNQGVSICKVFIIGKNATQSFAKTYNLPYKENMKTCILFSDETWSALSNNVISQHYKYWYSKNPHIIHGIPVYVLKIRAWCAVYVCKFIGAMIVKERNSVCYTQLIQNHSSGN